MDGWFVPRCARLGTIVLAVALVATLVAQDRARGWHTEPGVEMLLDRSAYTLNVVRGDGYLAWTEAGLCCGSALGFANGAGFMPPKWARTFKTMLRTPEGDVVRLSRNGVWAMVGGIDRGVLAYATGRTQADVRLLDLSSRKQRRVPRGVNTKQVEYLPTISGKWLLFGRVRPNRNYLKSDTAVVLTNLKTGRSRVVSSGTSYHSYTYPGQVNGDWLTFTACKFNKYGPNCGVSRYRISTGRKSRADLDGRCCEHGDPDTESSISAPGNVAASAVTSTGLVYMAMTSSQNTSWCAYSEIWAWDRKGRLAHMLGEEEDDYGTSNYDEPYAGLVVRSLYVDDGDPYRVVFGGYTTHEDHGYDCDVETSALYALGRGLPPPPEPGSTASPSATPSPETPTPSGTPPATPTPTETPAPSPSPAPPETPSPQPTPTCPLPICV